MYQLIKCKITHISISSSFFVCFSCINLFDAVGRAINEPSFVE